MQEKIWNGAKNDSIGLLKHYQNNASKFRAPQKISGTIARSHKKSVLKKVKKMWIKNQSNEEISNGLNVKNQSVVFSSGTFDIGNSLLPNDATFEKGISEIFPIDDSYVVLNILETQAETPLSFEDAKGAVISSYQNVLEQNWIETLRSKYTVSIDQNVLIELKSKLVN